MRLFALTIFRNYSTESNKLVSLVFGGNKPGRRLCDQTKNMEATMDTVNLSESNNPIAELINDDTYNLLISKGLIDEKSVRDFIIRKKFKSLRTQKVGASEAIESLRAEYPYLQFDTIRKIVYQPRK